MSRPTRRARPTSTSGPSPGDAVGTIDFLSGRLCLVANLLPPADTVRVSGTWVIGGERRRRYCGRANLETVGIQGASGPGGHPGSSSPQVSRRMSRLKQRDNGPELAVRRLLHRSGLRYRVTWPVPGQRRRTIDIAFTRARLAVYIDGCFWHGCPVHGTSPKSNSEWWAEKIAANRARDADVTAQLEALGWTVMRFWEHEVPEAVVRQVGASLEHQGS